MIVSALLVLTATTVLADDDTCDVVAGYHHPDSVQSGESSNITTGKCLDSANGLVFLYSSGYSCKGTDCPYAAADATQICDSTPGCIGFQFMPNPGGGVFNGQETLIITATLPRTSGDQAFTLFQPTGSEPMIRFRDYPSAYCCYIKGAAHSAQSAALSGGTLLLLVFWFALVLPYFVVGMVLNKTMKGKSGKELIPQVEMWQSVPGLIKEGFKFSFFKLKTRFKGDYSPL